MVLSSALVLAGVLVQQILGQSNLLTMRGDGAMVIFNTPSGTYSVSSMGDLSLQAGDEEALRFSSCGNTCHDFESSTLSLSGNLLASSSSTIAISGVTQWKLIALEDFQGIVTGWSRSDISNCGSSPNLFLGGYCRFAGATTSKAFPLPPHSQVRVQFNVHFIDRWEGESVAARVDGQVVWTQAHYTCRKVLTFTCLEYGVSMCGGDYPDTMSTAVEFTGDHSQSPLTLEFTSNSNRNSCEGSWGIDDVEIYVR